jgi:hypothetical protein
VCSEFSVVANGLPHDSILHVDTPQGKALLLDREFSKTNVPIWYQMNNSKKENVKMKQLKSKITWVTTKDIPRGEELVYNYKRTGRTEFSGNTSDESSEMLHPECTGTPYAADCGRAYDQYLRSLYSQTPMFINGYVVMRSLIEVKSSLVQKCQRWVHKHGGAIFNSNSNDRKNDRRRRQASINLSEKELPGLSDMRLKLGIFPTSQSWVVLHSLPGCQRQAAHIDYKIQEVARDPGNYRVSHGCVVALMNGTRMDVWPGAHHHIGVDPDEHAEISPEIMRKTLILNKGDVLVFRADCVHAGAAFEKDNVRLHCYLDIPEMAHPRNSVTLWDAVLSPGIVLEP